MSIRGFDCSFPVTARVAAVARGADMQFAGRYYGTPGSSKLLSRGEVRVLSEAGISIVTVFERTAGRALSGSSAGSADAELALTQAHLIGQPEGTAIYFAVDTDVDPKRSVVGSALGAYFRAVDEALAGRYVVGAYGGGSVLGFLLDHSLCGATWLAGAMGWIGSRDFDRQGRWHIKQYPEVKAGAGGNALGIEHDPCEAPSLERAGAWRLKLTDDGDPTEIDIFDLQRRLAAGGYYRGEIDGKPLAQTAKALVQYWQDRRK